MTGIILVVLLLLAPTALRAWQINSGFITLSHLALSSDEHITVTPEISSAIQMFCLQRSLDCQAIDPLSKPEKKIKFVELVNPLLFSTEKSPLYFLNRPIALTPRDFYVEGNGLFRVSDPTLTMFGTNYIEFRLYVPEQNGGRQVELALTALNSKPAPIQFDILVQDRVVDTILFDQGDGLEATKHAYLTLQPGYYLVKVLYANDWYDKDKGIDRNAYIRGLVLTPYLAGS